MKTPGKIADAALEEMQRRRRAIGEKFITGEWGTELAEFENTRARGRCEAATPTADIGESNSEQAGGLQDL
jgi:hypothetical protein